MQCLRMHSLNQYMIGCSGCAREETGASLMGNMGGRVTHFVRVYIAVLTQITV